MRNNSADEVRLRHMLDSIKEIDRYIENTDFEKFSRETLLQDGVIRHLMVIGEAADHLTDETKDAFTGVNWYSVRGLRNRLVHEYFRIDIHIVWDTVKKNLPELKEQIEAILS